MIFITAFVEKIVDFAECGPTVASTRLLLINSFSLNLGKRLDRATMMAVATSSCYFQLLGFYNIFQIFCGQMHSVFLGLRMKVFGVIFTNSVRGTLILASMGLCSWHRGVIDFKEIYIGVDIVRGVDHVLIIWISLRE